MTQPSTFHDNLDYIDRQKKISQKSDIVSKFSLFLAFCKKVVKSKMADPLYDKDIKENSLRCLMKSPRLIVSNKLNTSRVMSVGLKSPSPFTRSPIGRKRYPTEKVH